jgi:hypothetical protein
MTALELESYLKEIGVFKTQNVYITEVIDGKVYGMIPSYYKLYIGSGVGISISINYGFDKEKYIKIESSNTAKSYSLRDFTIDNLFLELKLLLKYHKDLNVELCTDLSSDLDRYKRDIKLNQIELH